jgi:Family of unknown function (DUF5924)/Protein of unknown function (DUF2914)
MSGRLPMPEWLWRWGVSIASLVLGLATLFVFRRGLPHLGWIVGYLLLLWLIVAVLAEARAPLETHGRRFVVSAAEYTIQTLYHNLLLFVLPAYWASTTLASPNALFLGGVAAGALVTAVDPLYRALARAHGWMQHTFLGFSMFAALNVALPLVGVRPIMALLGSAALAGLALTPALRRDVTGWARAHGLAVAVALVAVGAVWAGRVLVPPAPLFLADKTVARDVENLEPVDPVSGSVRAETVAGWGGGLTAYTAVHAPAGLRQAIEHVWWKDGQIIARVPLSPVLGGRAEGFRTWSRKSDLGASLPGRYAVDVMTASGQLIGRLSFTVTP